MTFLFSPWAYVWQSCPGTIEMHLVHSFCRTCVNRHTRRFMKVAEKTYNSSVISHTSRLSLVSAWSGPVRSAGTFSCVPALLTSCLYSVLFCPLNVAFCVSSYINYITQGALRDAHLFPFSTVCRFSTAFPSGLIKFYLIVPAQRWRGLEPEVSRALTYSSVRCSTGTTVFLCFWRGSCRGTRSVEEKERVPVESSGAVQWKSGISNVT